MNKTEVMFFFDTEDFTSNISANAILREAQICTEENIVGHFAIVGLLAKQLQNWGRKDIIEALKPHIIGTHTYGHSLHPNICEQSDLEDFDAALSNVSYYEDKAIEMINDALAPNEIMFACPPGNSKSYAAMYYYASKGIPFYCDTVVHDGKGSPLHYCNQEHIAYFKSMEGSFFKSDFDLDKYIDNIHKSTKRAIIYTHPNCAVKTEFWDKLNYDKANIREFGNWIEAPDRKSEESEMFYAYMQKLIQKIKNDDRFVITNLNEVLRKRQRRKPLTKDMLPSIYKSLKQNFYPTKNPSYSIAEIFLAVVSMLKGQYEYSPEQSFGFLQEPFIIEKSHIINSDSLILAAKNMDTSRFLPNLIELGQTKMGPADFLMAGLEFLITKKDEIEVLPKDQLISLDELDELKSFELKNSWTHSDDLKDEYLSKRLRLQSWTLRFE